MTYDSKNKTVEMSVKVTPVRVFQLLFTQVLHHSQKHHINRLWEIPFYKINEI